MLGGPGLQHQTIRITEDYSVMVISVMSNLADSYSSANNVCAPECTQLRGQYHKTHREATNKKNLVIKSGGTYWSENKML